MARTLSLAEAFERAIVEEPDDLAARLIYADWLQEHDDPALAARGDFIRVQCQLDQLPPDDENRPALEARERDLLGRYARAWAGGVRPLVRTFEFHRGFIERVRVDLPSLAKHGSRLFQLGPVRDVELVVERSQRDALLTCPFLERVTSLDLGYLGGESSLLAELFHSPRVSGLTSLRIRAVQAPTLPALLTSPHLARLATLDLSMSSLGSEGMQQMAGARLPGLTSLHLCGNGLGDLGLRRLAQAPLLGQLTALDLRSNNLGGPGADALARSPYLARLRALWLGFNLIDDWGVIALARCPALANLNRFYLGRNLLGLAGLQALAQSPHLAGLTQLDLDYNDLSSSALRALAASPYLNRLQTLYLRCGRGLTAQARQVLRKRFGDRVCRF
jgi:uncharacterized protein (TIGR02996 family)